MIWVIIVQPYIKSFESFIDVRKDGVMVVRERIVVDFGEEERHGIYRTIPYHFQGRKLDFRLISVEDDSGRSYRVFTEEKKGEVYWKIGDPEVLVKGTNVYNITYEVRGAINYFEDHDEVYWNVNGTKWKMKIQEVSCVVNLPDFDISKVKYTFYTGKKGSTKRKGKAWVEGNKIFFKAGPFEAGENLTIVVDIPKGVLIEPPKPSWISRNWGLIIFLSLIIHLSLMTLLYMLYMFRDRIITLLYMLMQYLRYRYGRDPRIDSSVMVEYYPPDNLKPAEIGTLIDGHADDEDISATIIDLAIRGYLRIRLLRYGDVDIEVLQDGKDLEGYERIIFEGIKEAAGDEKVLRLGERVKEDIKSLASERAKYKKLYDTFELAKDEVYNLVTQKGYFQENPKKVRYRYEVLGSVLLILGMLGIAGMVILGIIEEYISQGHPMLMFILGLIVSGLIILLISKYVPRKTEKGVEMYKRVLGFKEFINRVEKDYLEKMMDETKLEKILPYSVVLGIENIWLEKMKEVINHIPSWLETPTEDVESAIRNTTSSLNFSIASLQDLIYGSSSSSRFSGGGGGGVW